MHHPGTRDVTTCWLVGDIAHFNTGRAMALSLKKVRKYKFWSSLCSFLQLPLTPCLLRSKYSPLHPALRHSLGPTLANYVPLLVWGTKFHTQTEQQNWIVANIPRIQSPLQLLHECSLILICCCRRQILNNVTFSKELCSLLYYEFVLHSGYNTWI
jgi:hypothetical protein